LHLGRTLEDAFDDGICSAKEGGAACAVVVVEDACTVF
jgi:hypothetical protein